MHAMVAAGTATCTNSSRRVPGDDGCLSGNSDLRRRHSSAGTETALPERLYGQREDVGREGNRGYKEANGVWKVVAEHEPQPGERQSEGRRQAEGDIRAGRESLGSR